MAWKPLLEGQVGVYLFYSGDIILAHSLIIHLDTSAHSIYFYPCAILPYFISTTYTYYSDTRDPSCCPQAPAYYRFNRSDRDSDV